MKPLVCLWWLKGKGGIVNWLDKLKSVFDNKVNVVAINTVEHRYKSLQEKETRYLEKIENCKKKIENYKAIMNEEKLQEFVPLNAITDKNKLQILIDNEERFIDKWNKKIELLRKEK